MKTVDHADFRNSLNLFKQEHYVSTAMRMILQSCIVKRF